MSCTLLDSEELLEKFTRYFKLNVRFTCWFISIRTPSGASSSSSPSFDLPFLAFFAGFAAAYERDQHRAHQNQRTMVTYLARSFFALLARGVVVLLLLTLALSLELAVVLVFAVHLDVLTLLFLDLLLLDLLLAVFVSTLR